jgi:4-hydroxybenzoate polyprenyltransferase
VAVTALATALAVDVGRGTSSLWVALAVLAGQLSVGWSNDALDANRDRLSGRSEKPIVAGLVSARTVGVAASLAVVACVPLSMASGWRAASVHLAAVGLAWAYNLGIKATWLSPVPHAVAFALLPAFVTLGLAGHPWPRAGVMAIAGLLGVGSHLINTVPDAEPDRLVGVRGLPQRIGPGASLRWGVGMLGCSALSIGLLSASSSGARHRAGTLLAVVVALACDVAVFGAASSGRTRLAWWLTLVSAGACVLAFVTMGASVVLPNG